MYFRPLTADLEAGGWLSVMFTATAGQAKVMVFENIRQGETRLISHELHDYASAEAVAASLSAKYPEVPRDQIMSMLERCRTLFAAEGALCLRLSNDGSSFCPDCGTVESDDVHFVFFPPVPGTPLDQGSVSISWLKCCRQGRPEAVEAYGTLPEAAGEVGEILTAVLAAAGPEAQPQLQAALDLVCEDCLP